MAHDPKDHVMDSTNFTIFEDLFDTAWTVHLPSLGFGEGLEFQITKFMILELLAAGLILAIYLPIAKRARDGTLPKGAWWNAFESLLTFVRNDIAKPNLDAHDDHHHEHPDPVEDVVEDLERKEVPIDYAHVPQEIGPSQADKYVPFLWTMFLFILFLNLLGMIPFMGSPTASIWVTGALALCSFVMLHGAAILKMGPFSYVKALWPKIEIDIPFLGPILAVGFSLLIFVIEVAGTFIKSGVLAVRLFANMFAGHMVLAMILLFIVNVGHAHLEVGNHFSPMWWLVTTASVIGVALLSLLELFVAFLQAYVFTFLTALFMGMALNPEH